MEQYLGVLRNVMDRGEDVENRTGVNTKRLEGAIAHYDLRNGLPILTTKKQHYKAGMAEMLGFLLGFDNAAQFREIGCNFWNKDANENPEWLSSIFRRGQDDLGRIYGVQWRHWRGTPTYNGAGEEIDSGEVDQFKRVLNDLLFNPTSRRIVMSGWKADEMDEMALPPCHVLYRFSCSADQTHVNMSMYQRSHERLH